MKLLDGNPIEASSPGGKMWKTLSEGGQIIVLETTKGQDALDLTELVEQGGRGDTIAGWLGSLSLSSSKGLPDDYSLDLGEVRERLFELQESLVRNRRTLPFLVDVDACYGNPMRAFAMLNVLQVAMGVTENKRPDVVKVNSLTSSADTRAQMTTLEDMNRRLVAAKGVQQNTLVAARIENLIYGSTPAETIEYIQGLHERTDAIMIHWNKDDPALLFETADLYRKTGSGQRPLIAVTTAYGRNTTPGELLDHGFQVLVYPNQIVRTALSTSRQVYTALLDHETAGGGLDDQLPSTRELIRRFSEPGTFTYERIL